MSVFCLISSSVSSERPPTAASGLFIANEFSIDVFSVGVFDGKFAMPVSTPAIVVIVLLPTFDATPPPLRYVIVSVVFDGAIPYAFVTPGAFGSIDGSMSILPVGRLMPMLSGVGSSSSSSELLTPAPNCISIPSSIMRVTNRRGTFLSFNRYGISSLYGDASGSLNDVLVTCSNIVS